MTEDEAGAFAVAADAAELERAEEIRSRYAAIVESSHDAIISKNLDGVISAWNAAAERMFGYTERESIGRPITMIVPADLHEEEREIQSRLRTGEGLENYETVRVTRTGGRIDVSLTISPMRDHAGRIVGCSKIIRDITKAKQAEAALRQSEQRLAREVARAKTLHTISTRLISESTPESLYAQILGAAMELMASDFASVQMLAADQASLTLLAWTNFHPASALHPPKLELLGLQAAVAGFCEELSNRHDVAIDVHFEKVPRALPSEISLCLYRVLQEALQNFVKHGGSRHARVSLHGQADTIKLTVKDSGAGFHPQEALRGPGLGLTSMQERLKVVGGRLAIQSQRGRGTVIHAVAPLRPPEKPASADA